MRAQWIRAGSVHFLLKEKQDYEAGRGQDDGREENK